MNRQIVCKVCRNVVDPKTVKCLASGFVDGVRNGRRFGQQFAYWLVRCPCGHHAVLQQMGEEIKAVEAAELPSNVRASLEREMQDDAPTH